MREYGLATAAVGIATLARYLLDPLLGNDVPFTLYVAATTVVGVYASLGPALFTASLGGLLADVLFLPPRGYLLVASTAHQIELILYFFAAALILVVTSQLRASRSRLLENARQLEERTEALHTADRRKDEFLSMLAHELRNPLAPIVSAVGILRLTGVAAADPVKRAVDIIDRQAKHLTFLINDLLDVARISTGRIRFRSELVDLTDIVRQCTASLQPGCTERRIELRVHTDDQPAWVLGDGGRLAQVLDNLLDNACKFTPSDGVIDVSAHAEGSVGVLRVRDTGIGIEESQLGNIFGAFQQIDDALDRQGGGLGLGLHLVKRLVEKHGGTVTAHSDGLNHGSEFVVRLPLAIGRLGAVRRGAGTGAGCGAS